jgi:hypothetical protein
MSDTADILRALGQVQGKLETLESNQAANALSVSGSISTLHKRIEALGREVRDSNEKLFREGCAKAPGHADKERRLRAVENWRISHDTEARLQAGIWGGAAAVALMVGQWFLSRLEK